MLTHRLCTMKHIKKQPELAVLGVPIILNHSITASNLFNVDVVYGELLLLSVETYSGCKKGGDNSNGKNA